MRVGIKESLDEGEQVGGIRVTEKGGGRLQSNLPEGWKGCQQLEAKEGVRASHWKGRRAGEGGSWKLEGEELFQRSHSYL